MLPPCLRAREFWARPVDIRFEMHATVGGVTPDATLGRKAGQGGTAGGAALPASTRANSRPSRAAPAVSRARAPGPPTAKPHFAWFAPDFTVPVPAAAW